ncbi:MAG TPA: DUF3857 and transglutaminase domain-containing protein [Candidatus Angelobacter sp.]
MRILGILAVALLFASPSLFALDDWQPITQEDLKLTSEQASNAEAIILYHESISNDVKKDSHEYWRYKILTEKGKRYADVEIQYHARNHFGTQVLELKARTISPDGHITNFSGEVFDKTLIKGHGLKVKVKAFTFPNVQVGSIIEWRYTVIWSDNYVVPARWILQQNLMQKRIKFSYTPVSMDNHEIDIGHGNTADGLYYVEVGLPKGVNVKNNSGKDELEMTNVPAYEEEEFSPPAEMMKMRVLFYYGNRKMMKQEEFWKEQGKYWDKEVEKFVGHSSAVAQAAQQAASGADAPEQKLRKIYAAVQVLTNLSPQDQDFLEVLADNRKANSSAEQVLSQKSGTHDDLTRLFVAMARSVNLPAQVMRIASREETFFQPGIPDWDQLDSEVAIVSMPDGKEIFLDPGTRLCPFGLLAWQRTAVHGVRQKPGGGTELSETPAPTYAQALTQRIGELKLDRDGSLKGKIVLLWAGQDALERRINGAQTDEAGRKKAAEDELKLLLPGSAVVKLESLTGWDEPDKPLRALLNVELPGFAAITGKRLLLPTELFRAGKRQIFTQSERRTPVYFDYPYRVVDRLQVTLPADVQVENLPQSETAKVEFAMCKVQRAASGNVLDLTRDFAINGMSFPLKEYPSLKSFFDKVHANDDEQITLRTSPVAASN